MCGVMAGRYEVNARSTNTTRSRELKGPPVITCVVHYEVDPAKLEAFERFGRAWIYLVNKHGGRHHGYFLPSEGASDYALALFSFESFASYERYRQQFGRDEEFIRPTASGTRAAVSSATNGPS